VCIYTYTHTYYKDIRAYNNRKLQFFPLPDDKHFFFIVKEFMFYIWLNSNKTNTGFVRAHVYVGGLCKYIQLLD